LLTIARHADDVVNAETTVPEQITLWPRQ